MKTIGLLGGMSYASTLEYYRLLNQGVQKALGGSHSAKLLMYSFDYAELEKLLEKDLWDEIGDLLVEKALNLKNSGASALVLCANTMHIVADKVEKQVGLPIIHIAKETLKCVQSQNMQKVLLLGTKYTMESTLYPKIFKLHQVEVYTPNKENQEMIQKIIYHELIQGVFLEESKQKLVHLIECMQKEYGIEGVILGCTELPLLVKQDDVDLKLLNTLKIHAEAAVKYMLKV